MAEDRYTKAPLHPANTPESEKLMSIPGGMMRKDNPLTGLQRTIDEMTRKFFPKPQSIADIPTAQEEKARIEIAMKDVAEIEPDELQNERSRVIRLFEMLLRYLCGK
jgi:hypothetical protein